ncbi:uncharacterized protein LY89DRAFT_717320 [Mollisia scopiformis]|uniref:Uncharacterized protein n=1 Tax=Mollisia scopiformis TaxID=149040 RepID=A0A194XF40_MOLSC|nr:uncharacterized protein LY89DRAFT_717320 [Mollisia scopiformis]KUJ18783.1 hypothetical protein LY89DRAFT_717320 [Mollisia scopiformis]
MTKSMMKILAVFLTLITMVLAASLPGPVSRTVDVFNDGNNGVLRFKGPIHGVYVELNGTADEIYDQFSELYPEVVANVIIPDSVATHLAARDSNVELVPRSKTNMLCYPVNAQNWGPAWIPYLYDAINKLSVLGDGDCYVDGGPRWCVMLTCSRGDGIWLCNDNMYPISPNCGYLASYAWDMVFQCTHNDLTGGQEFDSDGYNVVVRNHSC